MGAPISKAAFDRVFGAPDPEKRAGRQRLCKYCGGWHLIEAWPHNCREPDWRPPQYLKAPMVMRDVDAHIAEPGVIINSRSDQREYMRRTGNVEFEDFKETSGTHRHVEEFQTRSYKEELVEDIKRAIEEDPLNRPPPTLIEQANEHVTAEEKVTTEDMEVVGDEHDHSAAA